MTTDLGKDLTLAATLAAYVPQSTDEAHDVGLLRQLARGGDGEAWSRDTPLHVTASAIIVHPPSGRVLLRWHVRMQSWLQVGGHADPGESLPYRVAVREAVEESALPDLTSWPNPDAAVMVQVAIVGVPANDREPEHQHGDLRFLLATDQPEAALPESAAAQVRWLPIDEALAAVAEDNLRVGLKRTAELLL